MDMQKVSYNNIIKQCTVYSVQCTEGLRARWYGWGGRRGGGPTWTDSLVSFATHRQTDEGTLCRNAFLTSIKF